MALSSIKYNTEIVTSKQENSTCAHKNSREKHDLMRKLRQTLQVWTTTQKSLFHRSKHNHNHNTIAP